MRTPPNSDTLESALQVLEEGLAASQTPPIDGTIHMVGEFSSGKTTLLRALLGDLVPDPLKPKRGLARQTLVPLDVVYGDEVTLVEVRRTAEGDREVGALETFPTRAVLLESHTEEQLRSCRLRLTIPFEALKPPEDSALRSICIVDTPGWNAEGDPNPEKHEQAGAHPIATVFVISDRGLDARVNDLALDRLLAHLDQKPPSGTRAPFVFLVNARETPRDDMQAWERLEDRCDEHFEPRFEKLKTKYGARFRFSWELVSLANERAQTDYQNTFAKEVLQAAAEGLCTGPAFQPPDWSMHLSDLMRIREEVRAAEAVVSRLADLATHGGAPMNYTQLQVHFKQGPDKVAQRLREELWRQPHVPVVDGLGARPIEPVFQGLPDPLSEGELAAWWNEVLLTTVGAGIEAAKGLKEHYEALIDQTYAATGPGDGFAAARARFNQHFADGLAKKLPETEDSLRWASSLFPEALDDAIGEQKHTEVFATLIAITASQQLFAELEHLAGDG